MRHLFDRWRTFAALVLLVVVVEGLVRLLNFDTWVAMLAGVAGISAAVWLAWEEQQR